MMCAASAEEIGAPRAGDDVVRQPDAVMDRAFTLDAPPEQVWPWLVQLGKRRAGWYLPRSLERFVPRGRRALRTLEPQWQSLAIGDVIPDYGGRDATFDVYLMDAPHVLVYTSHRRLTLLSWSLTLSPLSGGSATRLHLRLRLGPLKRPWLADTLGNAFDAATIVGLAAGLRERLLPERL